MADFQLVKGDCMNFDPGKVAVVITDPPYPDYYVELYRGAKIDFLRRYNCRQIVFWSAKADFPLDYTAVHIWDKKVGAGSQYERIFERNGGKEYKVYREYLINSTVAASYTGDEFTGHPSQKPLRLLMKLVEEYTEKGDLVYDPFMGSGTTGIACMRLGRRFVGVELDERWFEMAERRVGEAAAQLVFNL